MLLGEIPIEPAVDFDDFVRIHAQRQMKDLHQQFWMVETLEIMGFCPPINWDKFAIFKQ